MKTSRIEKNLVSDIHRIASTLRKKVGPKSIHFACMR